MEEVYGLSRTEIALSPMKVLDPDERLGHMITELKAARPIQYVLGYGYFCDLRLQLREGVLIPRPETEELVRWVVSTFKGTREGRILDIGTGSGCIAIALKSFLPGFDVSALDCSSEALAIAESNALENHCDISFRQCDILQQTPEDTFDCIVSNPPYVRLSEKPFMRRNVLDYEPESALFVTDDDPLLFYRTIATQALGLLPAGGYLFFEINENLGKETTDLLSGLEYTHIELRQDIFDRDRMIKAVRP